MTVPLRIAVPIHSFEPGGVERVALNLAAAWQADGADITVLLGRRAGAMASTAPALNYVVRPEPVPTAAWETLWLIWVTWRWLRANPANSREDSWRGRDRLAQVITGPAASTVPLAGCQTRK